MTRLPDGIFDAILQYGPFPFGFTLGIILGAYFTRKIVVTAYSFMQKENDSLRERNAEIMKTFNAYDKRILKLHNGRGKIDDATNGGPHDS